MQLHHILAARLLVQSIDILCHDAFEFSCFLQLRELLMRDVRLRIQTKHLIPVKAIEFLRVVTIKGMT